MDSPTIEKLALGDAAAKLEAVDALLARGEADAIPILKALLDGRLEVAGGKQVVSEEGGARLDAMTRRPVVPSGELEKVSINNRLRRTLERALAALGLFVPSVAERLAAARGARGGGGGGGWAVG